MGKPAPDSPAAAAGDNAKRRDKATKLLRRFHDARMTVASTLSELLAEGVVTPIEVVEAVGVRVLDRYLPPPLRASLLETSLEAGRLGMPFDDAALLRVVTPDLIARSLPLDRVQRVVAALCQRAMGEGEALETLDEEDEAALSITPGPPPLDNVFDGDDLADEVEMLPPSLPPGPGQAPLSAPVPPTMRIK